MHGNERERRTASLVNLDDLDLLFDGNEVVLSFVPVDELDS